MNKSGVHPQTDNVLVLPETSEKKTEGGLILPDDISEKNQWAQTRGTLIERGPMAFAFKDWPENQHSRKPQVGDTVYFGRYAGTSSRIEGHDGEEYWIIADTDIKATIEAKE